ncbi:Rad1/Rec1/Rad17 [Ephemerocybe angulata]|uniref:Rad1/Rec1/Rad17 n=1 Tax=Ephemerocybe angulata TaxID=980116 RepID=A0A8H6IIG8_9AGAR|nr:Rad1/Rec1/Rad17 [Tulosesus angulatus]
MSQDERIPAVLTASVADVRYLASLLRGVHFSNMASVTLSRSGLTITVEEARTLVGYAFIFAQVFDEFELHASKPNNPKPNRPRRATNGDAVSDSGSTEPESDEEEPDAPTVEAAFQINLNILIDCLNIFGTAGPLPAPSTAANNFKRWKRDGEGDDDGVHGEDGRANGGRGRIDAYLAGGDGKRTSMRMSYEGDGYPLTLLIAEDANGPTTTCEITTYQVEPHIDLEFDSETVVLRIIFKSSWLRDALSELDPSCEKLTFIANPSVDGPQRPRLNTQPMLRIQADGTHGSTEMDFPNDKEVLETFDCTQRVSFSYRFSHIVRTLRALSSSTKTSLRIDESGLLSLQFLMPKPQSTGADGSDGFVEFRCLALDE